MNPPRSSLLLILAYILVACQPQIIPTARTDPSPVGYTPTPTPPPYPPPRPSQTGTPGSSPTETAAAFLTPTPGMAETPATVWEGPGMIYLKYAADIWQGPDEIIRSNFDGSQKSTLPGYTGPSAPDFSPRTNTIVYESDHSLRLIKPGGEPRTILSHDQYIESTVISIDGTKIAYSLATGFSVDDTQQLWTVNPDGFGNTLAIDDTGQYITDPGPFRLKPIAWSLDNTKVFMITTTDSEATPTGLYVADLAAGTIEKALTPQVTLWDISFSPDRTQIAYRTFQWKPVPGFRPVAGPPFTLNVTDLTTGVTGVLLESETDQYFHPVWSKDGSQLAYTAGRSLEAGDLGIFVIDLPGGEPRMVVPGSEISRLRPWLVPAKNTLVYTEGDLSSGDAWQPYTNLYTINIDGTDKYRIDSGGSIIVLGALDD